jgi:hypothetical protein
MNAGVAAAKARPGGSASAFCEPVSAKSSSHSSNSSWDAADARHRVHEADRARVAREPRDRAHVLQRPVDVSECTTVTAA